METHSNKMLVASVVALLLAGLVAFSLWKSANERSTGRPYDIVGTQSVSGLQVGSVVTFSGVPVGRVTSVDLDPGTPGGVRVRIDITDDNLPITQGTVAKLSSDIAFGTALVTLRQANRSAPLLVARAGEEAPRIQFESGGMSEIVKDPSDMLESMENATERLLAMTSTDQQRTLTRLQELERSTARMAAEVPSLGSRIAPARQSLRDSAASALAAERQVDSMRRRLEQRSRTATGNGKLRSSLDAANAATGTVNRRLETVRGPVQAFSQGVVGTRQKIREVRESLAPVKEQVQQIEGGGISGPPTPDYKPKNDR